MSECVVRMEMPECCDECPMEYDGFMCGAIHKRFYPKKDGCYLDPLIDPSNERLPDCPIICQLPEGHGDLISRYAIATACSGLIRIEDGEYWIRVGAVRESIKSAPTIVPAERSET